MQPLNNLPFGYISNNRASFDELLRTLAADTVLDVQHQCVAYGNILSEEEIKNMVDYVHTDLIRLHNAEYVLIDNKPFF